MEAGKKRERACLVCEKPFPVKGKKLTCSDDCAKKRHQEQLARLAESRRIGPKKPKQCAICQAEFQPVHDGQKYCPKPECKKAGLETAIERQRQRRQARRLMKSKQTD
jgi:hypothetical protein